MIDIKNENLIKELIKNDYKIPFKRLEQIDFILTEIDAQSVNDWQKVVDYVNWYTQKTHEQGYEYWTDKYSFDAYHEYLQESQTIEDRELFPKVDCYVLTGYIKHLRSEESKKIEKELYDKSIVMYNENTFRRPEW